MASSTSSTDVSTQRRKRSTPAELAILEAAFALNPLPSREEREKLALKLGYTPRSVQVWHANRRQQQKSNERASSQSCHPIDFLAPPLAPAFGPQRAAPLSRTLSAPYATAALHPAPMQRTRSADLQIWTRMASSPERDSSPVKISFPVGSLEWTASRARKTLEHLAAPALRLAKVTRGSVRTSASCGARSRDEASSEDEDEAVTPDASMAGDAMAGESAEPKQMDEIDDRAVANLLLSLGRRRL